jgi:hypothetical protein
VGYPTITTFIRCQTANCENITDSNATRAPEIDARVAISRLKIEMRMWRRATRERFSSGPPGVRGPRLLAGSVKEVIQPQVPLRLPCYDFAPVTALAFGRLAWLPSSGTDFGRSQLPWRDGRCVQGPGTYSPWRS